MPNPQAPLAGGESTDNTRQCGTPALNRYFEATGTTTYLRINAADLTLEEPFWATDGVAVDQGPKLERKGMHWMW